jgi:hypothetical protein
MSDLQWNGDAIKEERRQKALQALHDGAELILEQSLEQVPMEYGDLASHGTVIDQDEKTVLVAYTGPIINGCSIAIVQHEDYSLSHPNKDIKHHPMSQGGRKAGYLRDPFNENVDRVLQMVADSLKE